MDFSKISSGKNSKTENFPVTSWFFLGHFRYHINTFYNFARAADDIADTNMLSSKEKIKQLNKFDNIINGEKYDLPAHPSAKLMRESILSTGIDKNHCSELLAAFRQDATKQRYDNWEELFEYCQKSATPVGRYLLELFGESQNNYQFLDPLCIALQVLNHLQDCKEDYETLNRIYIPLSWMNECGTEPRELSQDRSDPRLKMVFRMLLDKTMELLAEAEPLPNNIRSRSLRVQARSILNIAHELRHKLWTMDPLSGKIKLSKWQYFRSCARGISGQLVC